MDTFIDGDVVKYSPRDYWCHHGIAIVHIEDGKTWATDTYWGSYPTDGSYVDMHELAAVNIIGNTHTFGELPYPHDYEDFADSDKYRVPMGGESAYKRVRIGAVPVPEKVRERLAYVVEKAGYSMKSAERALTRALDELAAFDEAIKKLEA